jgi:eukaryotic-like serine/threonine-protein kinase
MIREGDLLAGKYRVEALLGAGGMGYVVSATHEQLQQRVAVKLLVPELAEDRDAAARFLREARAAVRIQSEHVARVLDVGEHSDGAPFMVMEFLSGRDLSHELAALGTLEIGVAIDYVLQACEAVAEAHALGVIHRDLKPANLFLARRADGSPLVKVLDFGVSKAIATDSGSQGPASPSLTAAQSLLGSPAYMSPEQARRPKTVDIRTDVWSLGIVLYEFLSGHTPFPGDAPLEVLTAAVSDPMPSLVAVRPDVPRELEAVIAKCLEKKADDRYQSVAEFAQALAPFAAVASRPSISRIAGILRSSSPPGTGAPVPSGSTLRSAGTPVPDSDTELSPRGAVTPPAREKETQMDWGKSESGARRSRRRVVAAVLALCLLLAGGIALQRAGERQASPVPSNAAGAEPARAQAKQPVLTPGEGTPVEPPIVSGPGNSPVLTPVLPESARGGSVAASAPAASGAVTKPVARTPAAAKAPPTTKAPAAKTRVSDAPPPNEEDPLEERR